MNVVSNSLLSNKKSGYNVGTMYNALTSRSGRYQSTVPLQMMKFCKAYLFEERNDYITFYEL